MSLITICIPTYRRPGHLKNSLERFVGIYDSSPSFVKYASVFVSDNCSNDATSSICSQYQQYHWFSWFTQSHNVGLDGQHYFFSKLVQTQYLWILGDDDILPKETLEEAVKLINDYSPSAIFFNVSLAHSVKNPWRFSFYPRSNKKIVVQGETEKALSIVRDNFQFISSQVFCLDFVKHAYVEAFQNNLKDINIYVALNAMRGLCVIQPDYFVYANRSNPLNERISDNLGPTWVQTFWTRPHEAILLYTQKVAKLDHSKLASFYNRQDFQFIRTLFVEVADKNHPYLPSSAEISKYVHSFLARCLCLVLISAPFGFLRALMKLYRLFKTAVRS